MFILNARPSESVAVLGVIDPGAAGPGTVTSGWVDMARFDSVLAAIMTGALGSAVGPPVVPATVTAKLQQASSATGTGAKDVSPGHAITALAKAAGGDNKQAIVTVTPDDLDIDRGYRFVRVSLTVADAASPVAAILIGLAPRHGIATLNDAATVSSVAP